MKTAVVTGANGFVGSHLVYRLLEQGWRVHALGRSTDSVRWNDRVTCALRDVGPSTELRGSLHFHEVDLASAAIDAGAVVDRHDSPSSTILFHVAGDTRFAPPDPAAQRRVNIDGALNVVRAFHGHIARAVHISTTFVAGDRTGVVLESELDRGQRFRNAYEKSKFDAERMLRDYAATVGLDLVITRPSVVTNDRETGRASTVTHLNALVDVVNRVHRFYKISEGEVVSDKIRLLVDPEATLNLAPVDSLAPLIIRIGQSPDANGMTFHLCHPRPESNQVLMDVMAEALMVKGKLALEFLAEIPPPLTRTEELLLGALELYIPYMNSRTVFDMRQVRAIVPECDAYFSRIDPPYIRRILDCQRAAKSMRLAQRCQPAHREGY